jgi:Iron-containing redox enzyme
MFESILRGLQRAGFRSEEILYFDLHCLQDIDHGRWLEEALERIASIPGNQELIRRGALVSLKARARFWTGIEEKIERARCTGRHAAGPDMRETTLREMREQRAADDRCDVSEAAGVA